MNVLAPIVRLGSNDASFVDQDDKLAAPRSALGQTARVLRLFRRPIWRYSCLHGVQFLVRAGYGISLRPQMVDGYDVSRDGLLWTMRLRDGLRFHDGTPVLAPSRASDTSYHRCALPPREHLLSIPMRERQSTEASKATMASAPSARHEEASTVTAKLGEDGK